MDRTDLEQYVGKRIQFFLKNKSIWTGYILELKEDCFHFKDKNNETLIIAYDLIEMVKEKKESEVENA